MALSMSCRNVCEKLPNLCKLKGVLLLPVRHRSLNAGSLFHHGFIIKPVQPQPDPPGLVKWHIWTGVLLERFPVVSMELTGKELEFQQLISEQEALNSMKNDWELQEEIEHPKVEEMTKEELSRQVNENMCVNKQRYYTDMYKEFEPAPVELGTDNDQITLKRKLDRKLICITQQTLGTKKCWGLPLYPFNEQQQKIAETEGMRKAAELSLKTMLGKKVVATFMGNAPVGFMKYTYKEGDQLHGVKIFYFKAQYNYGHGQKWGVNMASHPIVLRTIERKQYGRLDSSACMQSNGATCNFSYF